MAYSHHIAFAGDVWTDVTVEGKVKLISGHAYGAVLARYVDASNYYRIDIRTDTNKVQLAMVKSGWLVIIDQKAFAPSLNTWYTLRLEIVGSTLNGDIDNVKYVSGNNEEFTRGRIGFNTYASHVHFDDVSASGFGISNAYAVNIRGGATQIVITCTWSGSGNITIANLTSPEKTYYESNMSIYERTTVSMPDMVVFNIRRTILSIPAPTTSEKRVLYLNLSNVTVYQVSIEIS